MTGSSLVFSWEVVHDGVIRRSAETRGGALDVEVVEEEVEEGTIMRRGISGAVWRDIVSWWMGKDLIISLTRCNGVRWTEIGYQLGVSTKGSRP